MTDLQSSTGPNSDVTTLEVESTKEVHQILSAALSSCPIAAV